MVDIQADFQADPTSSSSAVRLDFASPFYLHPSESAGSSLLPAVFDGTGYRSWRRAVLRALSVKSKTGFINGAIVLPAPIDPSFMQWERCDDMVTSWILNSLSPDLRDSLQYVNNAKELWAELEERYDQTNGCKLYQLQKEINDLVQGTLDITGYYTRMKKLREEMSTIDVNSQCTCGGKSKLHKAEQDRRLIHFLMGLNEMYTTVRGSILMMNTLPSMAQAFVILSQEEKQREVKPHNHTALDSTSLNAYGQNNNSAGYKGFRTNYSSSRGGGTSSGNINNNTGFRGNSSTSRSSLFCDYCKKSGHTNDRCYKLHGYPSNPNPRFQKGKGTSSAANVYAPDMNGHLAEEEPEVRRQMPLNLSKDQYEQLLSLLGTLQVGNGASNSDNSNNMLNGAVNLAGPFSEEPSETW